MLINGRPVRLQEQNTEGGESEPRETPAQINARQNKGRTSRLDEIARGADARRAHELRDTDGERVVGDFEDGALEDTPEAREQRALREEQEAQEALDENARAAAEEEASGRARARALQEEGVEPEEGEEGAPPRRSQPADEEGDERVIDGVRHYFTLVRGEGKWLTLKQLRKFADDAAGAERAVQDAQEAVRNAASAAARTPEPSVEIPSDEDLEVIISSAAIGEEDAVKKLAQLVRQGLQPKTQVDVRSAVSEQIATQRAIERAERENKDLLSDESLSDVFKVRLSRLAKQKPTMMIVDAYREVGKAMRTEFAPMLRGSKRPQSKLDRKRTLTPPPEGAARQRQEQEEEQEEPVSSVIDQLAKGRGQQRAIRQRRY